MVIKSRMRDVNHTNFKVEDVVVGDEVCIFNVRLTQKMTTEVKQYVYTEVHIHLLSDMQTGHTGSAHHGP